MVAGDLLEITPARFVAAQELVGTLPGVLEVQTYGDKLHLFVDDYARRKNEIEAALSAQGIGHDEARQIEVRMEEAFISLVRRHQADDAEEREARV